MFAFFQSIRRTQDWLAASIVALIAVVAGWLVFLPLNQDVQRVSLDRFHLATPNYLTWAIQQPIPAMYNFENRYWISDRPLAADELQSSVATNKAAGIDSNFANHFPARMITFGDARFLYLYQTSTTRYLYLRSRYQNEELKSLLVAKPDSNGGFVLNRYKNWEPECLSNE